MIIKRLQVGPLMTNCYIVGCEETREGAIIDPGREADLILAAVKELNLTIKYVINTHGHFDHILANRGVLEATEAKLAIHQAGEQLLAAGGRTEAFGVKANASLLPDVKLCEGDMIPLGKIKLKVLHTPGHSPGSISLYNEKEGVIFDGDVLFRDGIGRTDLPGSSHHILMETIRDTLLNHPDDTIVYPGHGSPTTIGRERRNNPFLS